MQDARIAQVECPQPLDQHEVDSFPVTQLLDHFNVTSVSAPVIGNIQIAWTKSWEQRTRVAPVGVGPIAAGLMMSQKVEGWYFEHDGDNWGFKVQAIAHVAKGYCAVIKTNGDNGGSVMAEIQKRIAITFAWDLHDIPVQP